MNIKVLVCTVALSALFSLGAAMTGPQASSILERHNYWRMIDSNGVAQPLVWDDKLAKVAQDYAGQCVFQHNRDRAVQAGHGYSSVGENLYFSSVRSLGDDLSSVVDAWVEEKKDYDRETNTCANGKICGHYTQVVWKNTITVGCGLKSCSNLKNFGMAGTIVVCNYSPAGNFVGQTPFEVENLVEALLQNFGRHGRK